MGEIVQDNKDRDLEVVRGAIFGMEIIYLQQGVAMEPPQLLSTIIF